jgi:hypothetical protein
MRSSMCSKRAANGLNSFSSLMLALRPIALTTRREFRVDSACVLSDLFVSEHS